MKTSIRRLGNSHGVIIPKAFLAEIGLGADDPVEMRIKKGRLVVSPLKPDGRATWEADSKRLVVAGEAGAEWPPGRFAGAAEGKA
jgi:antitoxin MazE